MSLLGLRLLPLRAVPTVLATRSFQHNSRPLSFILMSKRRSDILDDDTEPRRSSKIRKMATPVTTTIDLTPREAQLKGLLLDVAKYVDRSQKLHEPVVLRWAGGWVRDKLLGMESHDIDTAVNVMTGEAFTKAIVELCEDPEVVKKHNVISADIGALHKIAANPEKSKHLETTTIKLLGFDVDFVNLRKETYTEDSRNPQMEFGTAEEDAMRRDATVNALFYNLNTGRVEDFTGGLADMRSRLIKTPMDPLQTFKDDPLRVLRLIRFASRFEFTIDPAAERVMGDPSVLDALCLKISRERVGMEVEKMFKGKHPKRALELIDTLGLYHTVFTDPTHAGMARPDTSTWRLAYECLEFLRQNKTPGSIYDVLVRSDEASYFAWVLAALCPWQCVQSPPLKRKGKAPTPFATLVAREGIKATNKLCNVITASHEHRLDIMTLKTAVCQKVLYIRERDRFGMAIRKWDGGGGHWRLQVLSTMLVESLQVLNTSKDVATRDKFLADWQLFLDHLQDLDVMTAPSLPRLLNGTDLAEALGVKPGRWMNAALDICVAWQLRNPDTSDPAGAINEVRSKRGELGIPAS